VAVQHRKAAVALLVKADRTGAAQPVKAGVQPQKALQRARRKAALKVLPKALQKAEAKALPKEPLRVLQKAAQKQPVKGLQKPEAKQLQKAAGAAQKRQAVKAAAQARQPHPVAGVIPAVDAADRAAVNSPLHDCIQCLYMYPFRQNRDGFFYSVLAQSPPKLFQNPIP
jgi:hypothetical protein